MKSIGAIGATLVLLLFGACAPPAPTVDLEAETAALRAAADAYHAAASAKDIEKFVTFNANDVLLIPPNQASAQGTEGARSTVTAFTELPDFQIHFETPKVEVAASGDMGYTFANAAFSFQGPDGSKVEDRVRDFHLWKKDAGSWKVSVDIWNSELPLPGAPH